MNGSKITMDKLRAPCVVLVFLDDCNQSLTGRKFGVKKLMRRYLKARGVSIPTSENHQSVVFSGQIIFSRSGATSFYESGQEMGYLHLAF
jgi:hypothetical protein